MTLITKQHRVDLNEYSENRIHLSIALTLNSDAVSQFCLNFLNDCRNTETELDKIAAANMEYIYISKTTKNFLEKEEPKCHTYSADPADIAELKNDIISTHLLHENISKVTGLIQPFLEKLCNSASSLRSIAIEMLKNPLIQKDTTLESLNEKLESIETLENLEAFLSLVLLNAPNDDTLENLLNRLIYNKKNDYSLTLSLRDISLLETLRQEDFPLSISKEISESFFSYIELKKAIFSIHYLHTQFTVKAGSYLKYKQTKGWDHFVHFTKKIQSTPFSTPEDVKMTKLEQRIKDYQNRNLEPFKQLISCINTSPNGHFNERVDAVKQEALDILQKISYGIVLNIEEINSLIKLQLTNYSIQNASNATLLDFSIFQKTIKKIVLLKKYSSTENCSFEQKVDRIVYCKIGWNIFSRTLARITTVYCRLLQKAGETLSLI